MGLESEVGGGCGYHPKMGTYSQGWKLNVSPQRALKPCFTSLVALEVKESGLMTSTMLSLP